MDAAGARPPAGTPPRPPPPSGRSAPKGPAGSGETGIVPLDMPKDMLGRTLGGRYVLRDVLGSGGMGTVFEAEHLGLKRAVAIKVLNPSQAHKKTAVKRFQQEARAAGSIGHANICEVYDLGALDDGSPYLVMEKLTGRSLAQRLQKETRIPADDVVEIILQALSGLGAAHDKGIVHRDIKPDNIFIARRSGANDIVKVVDFGVSKIFARGDDTDGEEFDLTRTGMVMGTPYYMSPEQASGERNLDARVDIYACGIVMYEAVTGRRPFLAPNYNALLLKIIAGDYRPPSELVPELSPAFEAVVRRAMAPDRADRYSTASEMQRDLIGLRTSAAPLPKPPPRRSALDDLPMIGVPPSTRKEGAAPYAPASSEQDETVVARNVRHEPPLPPPPPSAPRPPQNVAPPAPMSELDIHIEFSDTGTGSVLRPPIISVPMAPTPPPQHAQPSQPPKPMPGKPSDAAALARAAEWEDELPTEIYQPPGSQRLQPPPPAPPAPQSASAVHRPGIFDDDDDDDDADLHGRKADPLDPRLKPRPR